MASEMRGARVPRDNGLHTARQRTFRANQIARFTACQRRKRGWMSLADVADWSSREDGSIEPVERKRALAFDLLEKDFLVGEFEEGGRSCVLFLHPYTRKVRLTRDELKGVIGLNPDYNHGRSEYLPYCWLPQPRLASWFNRNNLGRLPLRFEAQSNLIIPASDDAARERARLPEAISPNRYATAPHNNLVAFFRENYRAAGAATNREDMDRAAERHFGGRIPVKALREARKEAGVKGKPGRPRKSGK